MQASRKLDEAACAPQAVQDPFLEQPAGPSPTVEVGLSAAP